jgi:thiamine kinase-like enzyme
VVLTSPTTTIATAAALGNVIGQFLADMHDPSIVLPVHMEIFRNEIGESTMEACIEQVRTFLQASGISDYDSLAGTALHHWRTRRKAVFAQGDIWFGTILVDTQTLIRTRGDEVPSLNVGICDWEWAGPNDPAADIAQLGM